jgi:membrane protein YqaA with SNARE-associated domain
MFIAILEQLFASSFGSLTNYILSQKLNSESPTSSKFSKSINVRESLNINVFDNLVTFLLVIYYIAVL